MSGTGSMKRRTKQKHRNQRRVYEELNPLDTLQCNTNFPEVEKVTENRVHGEFMAVNGSNLCTDRNAYSTWLSFASCMSRVKHVDDMSENSDNS